MDLLKIVSDADIMEYTENLNYNVNNFMGAKLFTKRKVADPIVTMRRLVEYGNLPVMAQVHGYDTEAIIGDRTNFTELKAEPLLIKEKLALSERMKKMLGRNAGKSEVIDFIYDDVNTLVARNLTRHEVANMELLSTGRVTVHENNITTVIDYGMPAANTIPVSSWDVASHDILGDLKKVIDLAKKHGYKIVRAITSSTIIGYMMNNNAIQGFWMNKADPLTESALLSWINANYGIEFVTNDEMYKVSANASTAYRFFDENTISFLTTKNALGEGLYGITPEQEKLFPDGKLYEKSLVSILRWEENDPVETWTKGSSLYLPVIKDINGLFIAKHTASV